MDDWELNVSGLLSFGLWSWQHGLELVLVNALSETSVVGFASCCTVHRFACSPSFVCLAIVIEDMSLYA